MKYLIGVLLSFNVLANDVIPFKDYEGLSPQDRNTLSLCSWQADLAKRVQLIRHQEEVELPQFTANIRQLMAKDDPYLMLKVLKIGEQVFNEFDIGITETYVYVVTYQTCVNEMRNFYADTF